MIVCFTDDGWDDYQHWVARDRDILARLNRLIEDVRRQAFTGLGKPEPLKGDLKDWWSRRITADHRLIYAVSGMGDQQRLTIVSCRYHYEKR